jgi:hypothetical protein
VKIRTKAIALVFPILFIGVVGSGLLYLRTDSFKKFARSMLISSMEKSTGMNCSVERLKLDAYRGNFIITGLALRPRMPAPGLASLRIAEVQGTLSVSSVWHFRMRLANLSILRPQLEIFTSDQASSWNPQEAIKALKISLRLEAGRVAVEDGRITINNRTNPFHLLLEDLDCEIRYVGKLPSYKIHVNYRRSRIHWENRDILHDLDFLAELSLQGLAIENFKLQRGDSLFTGTGSVMNWNFPILRIHTSGILDLKDLVLAHSSLSEGGGAISVRADLQYDQRGISSNGQFTSHTGRYRKMVFRNLAGNFQIQRDVLNLRNVSGRIAQGTIMGHGDIQLREGNKDPNRITVNSKNVPIIEAARLLNLPLLDFENTADANTVLVWHGGQPLRADCDAYVHGVDPKDATSIKRTLLDGGIRFTYFEPGFVYVTDANLRTPYTTVQATGGARTPFQVRLTTNRISEPLQLIAGFSPPVADLLVRYPDLSAMAGVFEFNGDVQIKSSSDIEYKGSASVRNGRWRSYYVDAMSAQADFRSPRLQLHSLKIRSGLQEAEGSLNLKINDRERLSEFGFQGDLHRIALASLKDFGVDVMEIKGTLSGSGDLTFKENTWEGDGRISIEYGQYREEAFDSLKAQMRLRNRLFAVRAEIRRGAILLKAEGDFDLKDQQLNISTNLKGFPLGEIPAIRAKRLPVRGSVSVSGVLQGTPRNPSYSGGFDVDSLQYDRWDLGQGKGRIEMKDGAIHATAAIQSDLGRLTLQSNISTNAGYTGSAKVEFEDLQVQKIIGGKTPIYLEELSTDLNGKVDISGRFEDFATIQMKGELNGAHFKIHEYELRNNGGIQFSIANRNLHVESARFIGEGTRLLLTGDFPLDDSPKLNMDLNGAMNLRLLEGIENKARLSGTADLNIHASGSRFNPQIIGRASLQDARLDYAALPFRLSAMQGDIVFSRNIVRLENVRGAMASGSVQLSGAIEHENAVFRSINLAISLQNARLPYPKDFRSLVNADLVLRGAGDAQILGGEIKILRTEYLRGFNLLEQFAGRSIVSSGPLTTDPYLLGLRLNLEIHSDNGLYIENELAKLRGSVRLTLRGTPAYPSLTGRVEASEGTIFFHGNRFNITQAAANFVDRNRISPVLEIRAEADVKTYRLILDAFGDLDHLSVNVTSDPPMSTVDILSLLTTGKSDVRTATSQQESEATGISAASVLSENLTGVLGKRVQRILGLESFRVDPFLAGAENDPTARITISERLSKDLVVTFSRNLTTNREQIVIIEYDVSRNLSMVATRDEYGKFGLDFRLRKRWR